MKISTVVRIAVPFLLLLSSGCGGGNSLRSQSNVPPTPTSADAWFGTAGNVLVSDRASDKDGKTDFLWIGFNSATAWQAFLAEHQKLPQGGFMFGGVVIPTVKNTVNFYFDPNISLISVPQFGHVMVGHESPHQSCIFARLWTALC